MHVFLLRELRALLVEEGLLDTDDVVIVAAKDAYPEYLERSAYVCQPGRSFREGLDYLGFYAEGRIQREIARIRYREDSVTFSPQEVSRRRRRRENHDEEVAHLIEELLGDETRTAGELYQVFLLSSPTDQDTVKLAQPIHNDTKAASGRPWAWTLSQRYVRLANLTTPGIRLTSDLEL